MHVEFEMLSRWSVVYTMPSTCRGFNQNREFFEIEPHHVISILELLLAEDVTEVVKTESSDIGAEDLNAAKTLRRKRPSLDFHVISPRYTF